MTPITNLSPTQALDSVEELLKVYKDQIIATDNPLVNQQLTMLLGKLYDTQKNAGLLSKPVIVDTSALTTADIIALLMIETRKTSNLVATATLLQIKAQQKNIIANNESQLEKLKDANEKTEEANDLKNGLDIFKWVMLAVSVILLVLSVIATICTFGAAAPAIVAAVVVLVASIALTIVGSVPVDGENNTAMDLATKKMGESIAAHAKANMIADLKSSNKDWDKLSDEEQQELIAEAEATGTYSAMAIMITLQVIIAVVMIACTAGAASGTAASYTVNAASTTGMSTARAALEAAKNAIMNNLSTIMQVVRNISFATQGIKAAGTVAAASVQIEAAQTQWEATDAQADADLIKALTKYLSSNNDALIELIEELYAMIAGNYDAVAAILRNEHAQRGRIILQREGAHFA